MHDNRGDRGRVEIFVDFSRVVIIIRNIQIRLSVAHCCPVNACDRVRAKGQPGIIDSELQLLRRSIVIY